MVSLVVLLNVVIAMMADTYAVMTSVRRGIYNYNILLAAPAYKPDKYYSGLMQFVAPFNIIGTCLLPFYCCISDRKKLRVFNLSVNKIGYAMLLLPTCAVFLVVNLVLSPFAYIKTCAHKFKLLSKGIIKLQTALGYLLIGLPVLLLTQVTDLWDFVKASYDTQKIKHGAEFSFVISEQSFVQVKMLFEKIAAEVESTKLPVSAFTLIGVLRQVFNLNEHIRSTIYSI